MVDSWIEWTRKNIDTTSTGYPKVTSLAITEPPWKDEQRDIRKFENQQFRDDRLTAFTAAVAPDAADFAPRFTAIHYYYTLLCRANFLIRNPKLWVDVDELLDDDWDLSDLESLASAFEEDRALLVRSLPVENVPGNWQFIRWEILNSYLIQDWERAKDLYDQAEKLQLLERSELQALRGQFRFLKVYFSTISQGDDDGLDSLTWEPKVYDGTVSEKRVDQVISEYFPRWKTLATDQKEEFMGVIYHYINKKKLFNFGVSITKADLKLGDQDQEWLEYASIALKSALEKKPDFPSGYRSILAGSYFLTGHFHDAAKQYERLIELEPGSLESVYQSLALSYRRAGEPQRAIESLQKCQQKHPGVHKEIAEIQAQEGRYFEAYESLWRYAEINPQADKDLGTNIALALGGIVKSHQDPSVYARKFVESNPETFQLTESLLKTNWEAFSHLKEEARQKWIYASITLHTSSGKGPLHLIRIHDAAALFAEATEIQLREEIFKRFREHATSKRELKELLSREMTGKEEGKFYGFLSGRTFLALGDMCKVLELSANPKDEILRKFNHWLPKKLAPLVQRKSIQILHLREICQYRNPVRHEGKLTGDPALIHSRCREIVDLIV